MDTAPLPRRWWKRPLLRLSVRMLMVLVLLVGGGLGWVVRRATIQRQAVESIKKAGGRVAYDWEFPNGKPTLKGATSPWVVSGVDSLFLLLHSRRE
jgi:hypothetical protein